MVWQTSLVQALKHLAGRHDQHTHAPRSSYGMLNGEFLQGANQRIFVAKTKGGGKVTIYGDQAGVDAFKEVLDHIPKKALDIIESSPRDITVWYKTPEKEPIGRWNVPANYTYSSGHRIAFGDTSGGLSEVAHLLDNELGQRKGGTEFSRTKRYQQILKKETMGYHSWADIHKAAEDFDHAFSDYVIGEDRFEKRKPLHYALMQELFGD